MGRTTFLLLTSAAAALGVLWWWRSEKKQNTYKQALQILFLDLKPREIAADQSPTEEAQKPCSIAQPGTPFSSPSVPHRGACSPSPEWARRRRWFAALAARAGLREGGGGGGGGGAKFVHVAGTNGKGSVCELVRAAIQANGKKVGVFTSPHLHSPRERIRIGSKPIPEEDLTRLTLQLENSFSKEPWITFFDKLLAVAICYFAEKDLDYIIFEVGIGGRFDSTNYIEHPSCVVITSISYDHQALLGNTIKEIASQKAGIIKPNRMVFTSEQQSSEVLSVLKEETNLKKAALDIIESTRYDSISRPRYGNIHWENVQLAAAVVNHLDLQPIGFETAFWPGRFEVFSINGQKIVLDGAHNLDAVNKLFQQISYRFPSPPKQTEIVCVFGALKGKDISAMLSILSKRCASFVFVRAPHPRAFSPAELAAALDAVDNIPDHSRTVLDRSRNSPYNGAAPGGRGGAAADEDGTAARLATAASAAEESGRGGRCTAGIGGGGGASGAAVHFNTTEAALLHIIRQRGKATWEKDGQNTANKTFHEAPLGSQISAKHKLKTAVALLKRSRRFKSWSEEDRNTCSGSGNPINSSNNNSSKTKEVERIILVCGSLYVVSGIRRELSQLYPHLFSHDDWAFSDESDQAF